MLASRRYKRQGTQRSYSSAEKCRGQHSSSRTVRHWKVLGLPTDTACYVHRLGQAFGRGSCTIGIPSTARPTQKAEIAVDWLQLLCPLFLERDKGCTILSSAATNKAGILLKRCDSLQSLHSSLFSSKYFVTFTSFPFCTDIILGTLPFFQGQGGGKGRRGCGVWRMKTELRALALTET